MRFKVRITENTVGMVQFFFKLNTMEKFILLYNLKKRRGNVQKEKSESYSSYYWLQKNLVLVTHVMKPERVNGFSLEWKREKISAGSVVELKKCTLLYVWVTGNRTRNPNQLLVESVNWINCVLLDGFHHRHRFYFSFCYFNKLLNYPSQFGIKLTLSEKPILHLFGNSKLFWRSNQKCPPLTKTLLFQSVSEM